MHDLYHQQYGGLSKSSKDWAYAICDRGYRIVQFARRRPKE